ncbi:MAG: hypothetical protein Tsb0014_04630 [Pleurocapsa sp.]
MTYLVVGREESIANIAWFIKFQKKKSEFWLVVITTNKLLSVRKMLWDKLSKAIVQRLALRDRTLHYAEIFI